MLVFSSFQPTFGVGVSLANHIDHWRIQGNSAHADCNRDVLVRFSPYTPCTIFIYIWGTKFSGELEKYMHCQMLKKTHEFHLKARSVLRMRLCKPKSRVIAGMWHDKNPSLLKAVSTSLKMVTYLYE